jgi:hypothetical protein
MTYSCPRLLSALVLTCLPDSRAFWRNHDGTEILLAGGGRQERNAVRRA